MKHEVLVYKLFVIHLSIRDIQQQWDTSDLLGTVAMISRLNGSHLAMVDTALPPYCVRKSIHAEFR